MARSLNKRMENRSSDSNQETEFLIRNEDLRPNFKATGHSKTSMPRVKARSKMEFALLSPFPHCVLPEHFFERYLQAQK